MVNKSRATEIVRRRYNRFAPFYNLMEGVLETSRMKGWRKLLWSKSEGSKILEVGVGTGRNFSYYPPNADIIAIDLSDKMLERAQQKARKEHIRVQLEHMDVQELAFDANSFDTVIGSLVFCTVPDPIRGLVQIERVCRPGGKVLLLEHVLSSKRSIAMMQNFFNPLALRMFGDNMNRPTVDNVIRSGLGLEKVTDLDDTIFKLIEARKKMPPTELQSRS